MHTLIEVSEMQKWEWALLLGMVGTVCCSALAGTAQSYGSLEQNVLRLHILANSDSIDDQALKLKVRDKVLAQTENLFQSQPGKCCRCGTACGRASGNAGADSTAAGVG